MSLTEKFQAVKADFEARFFAQIKQGQSLETLIINKLQHSEACHKQWTREKEIENQLIMSELVTMNETRNALQHMQREIERLKAVQQVAQLPATKVTDYDMGGGGTSCETKSASQLTAVN